MKSREISLSHLWLLLFIISSCGVKKNNAEVSKNSQPVSQELYDTIIHYDSVFFNAYNHCNLDIQGQIYSDSIEFYHDKGGLMTSKQAILDATKKNICGKVTREMVPGSIEVFPINQFGAVEIGLHKFHNNTEKVDTISKPDKFIIIWKHANNRWQISRVVSLH